MNSMIQCLAVGVAGFFGALARLVIGKFWERTLPTTFPVGTLFINITGSFILGWFLAHAGSKGNISETTRLAVAVGFVGAYTTFSTWMYDSTQQMIRGQGWAAMVNIVGSILLGLLAVRAGMRLGMP